MNHIFSRRHAVGMALLVPVMPASIAIAEQTNVGLIVQLGELLSKAAEALAKLGDSVAHLVKIGVTGLDAVQARRAHNDLVELRRLMTSLVTQGNLGVLNAIDGYLSAARAPGAARVEQDYLDRQWRTVLDHLEKALRMAQECLGRIDMVRGDFVWQDAYTALREALESRVSLIGRLRRLPAPKSDAELEALRSAGLAYRKLSQATAQASDRMADYVKSLR